MSIVAAASIDRGRFAKVHDLVVTTTTSPATDYVIQPAATIETALVCLKTHHRRRTRRLCLVGQGYDGGLAGLAPAFSVDVDVA